MKVSVLRSTLSKGLQKAVSATGPRATLPVLGNVLIEAVGGKILLTGTDLEVRIETSIDAASIEREGRTTLPARKFLEIVNLCEGDTVNIDVNEQHHAKIEIGTANFLLYGLAPEDFPRSPEMKEVRVFTVPQSELAHSIAQVAYSVNEDESRRVLTGILFSVRNGAFLTVGTDGKRLALVERPVQEFSGEEGDAVVPLRSAEQVKTVLDKVGDVKVLVSDKNAMFDFAFDGAGSCRMTCKLLEGNYPNYRQVIPKELGTTVTVPTKPFLSALGRVGVALGGDSPVAKLTFADNTLKLQTQSDSFGEAADSMPIEYTGEEITLNLNSRFLLDPFKNSGTEKMNFKFNDGSSPIVLDAEGGFLSVIMPIRGRQPTAAAPAAAPSPAPGA